MYQDSTEGEGGDEARTEVGTEVVSEVEEEDTVPTGASVAGMSLRVVIRVSADWMTVGEDAAINSWRFEYPVYPNLPSAIHSLCNELL
jgi:hypothetical protein